MIFRSPLPELTIRMLGRSSFDPSDKMICLVSAFRALMSIRRSAPSSGRRAAFLRADAMLEDVKQPCLFHHVNSSGNA